MDEKQVFLALLKKWQRDTMHLSYHVKNHPAYQEIIAMKERVIPLILEELQKRPSWILIALFDITGENPCPQEHAGRLGELTADWLAWGKEKGFLPAE